MELEHLLPDMTSMLVDDGFGDLAKEFADYGSFEFLIDVTGNG